MYFKRFYENLDCRTKYGDARFYAKNPFASRLLRLNASLSPKTRCVFRDHDVLLRVPYARANLVRDANANNKVADIIGIFSKALVLGKYKIFIICLVYNKNKQPKPKKNGIYI